MAKEFEWAEGNVPSPDKVAERVVSQWVIDQGNEFGEENTYIKDAVTNLLLGAHPLQLAKELAGRLPENDDSPAIQEQLGAAVKWLKQVAEIEGLVER